MAADAPIPTSPQWGEVTLQTARAAIPRVADTLLAADLRRDGRPLALARVAARLLGVESDEVYRRVVRAQRRLAMRRTIAAAVIIALVIASGLLFRQAQDSGQQLADVAALVEQYAALDPDQAIGPGAKERLKRAITAIAEGAATDPRYAKALQLIAANKPGGAEPLLRAVAEDKGRRADRDRKDAAAAYRNLGAIAGFADPKKALDAYEKALEFDPDDAESLLRVGDLQIDRGYLDEAERRLERVLALAPAGQPYNAYWAQLRLGDIREQRGDLAGALAAYRESFAKVERMASAKSDDVQIKREYSVVYNNGIGAVLVAQGNLPEALKTFRDGLAIADRLAKADPGNAGWQRELIVSYVKVGDVLVAQGNLPEALKTFRDGLAIADRLAKADPANARWQRDLSVSYNKVGVVLVAQGNLPEALKTFRDSQVIFDRLAKADPGNAGWQRDLSVSYDWVGDVLVAQGNLPEALKTFRDSQVIFDRLAKADPGNAGWQRDLSVSYDWVGDVLVAQGNLPEALKTFRDGLGIADRLAKADPGNAGWQRDLSVSYNKVGVVLLAQGNLPEALKTFRDSQVIFDRLAKADPGNAGWQRDLSVSYDRVGDVLVAQGNLLEALKTFRDGLSIRDRLAKADPGNAGWQRDLSVSYNKVGGVLVAQGNLREALNTFRDGLGISDRLANSDPSNALWRRDLQATIDTIGGLGYKFVLVGNFSMALEAADQAISRAPDLIWLYANRAYALMFLSRLDDARALYLKYRGVKNVLGEKSWDAVIFDDFTELRMAGLTHPLMDEIEKLLVP